LIANYRSSANQQGVLVKIVQNKDLAHAALAELNWPAETSLLLDQQILILSFNDNGGNDNEDAFRIDPFSATRQTDGSIAVEPIVPHIEYYMIFSVQD